MCCILDGNMFTVFSMCYIRTLMECYMDLLFLGYKDVVYMITCMSYMNAWHIVAYIIAC